MMTLFVANCIPRLLWERVKAGWNVEQDKYFSFPISITDLSAPSDVYVNAPQSQALTCHCTLMSIPGSWDHSSVLFVTPRTKEDVKILKRWQDWDKLVRHRGYLPGDNTRVEMHDAGHDDCHICEEARIAALAQRLYRELGRQYDSDDNKGHFVWFGTDDEQKMIVTIDGKIDLMALAKVVT